MYLAREEKHGRTVAIKVLKPDLTESIQAERFLREIGIIAHLSHPHILALLDSGRAGSLLYYVTPYVMGESLRRRLEQVAACRLPIAEAMRIACEALRALDYAHRQGIVHRDVKPENVLLSEGQAIVADFGIARAMTLADDERMTFARTMVGTPGYMSPEQCTGESEVDERSDIYSLGCVLYEMLAGHPPFRGTPSQVIAQHVSAPVPSLRDSCPLVPYALERVVRRALAKDPADRFATAAEFAEAIDDVTARGARWLDAWRRVRRFYWTDQGRGVAHRSKLAALALVGIAAGATAVRAFIADSADQTGSGAADLTAELDTSRYAILPPAPGDSVTQRLAESQLLRDALARWTGITVADAYQVAEAAERDTAAVLGTSAAQKVAAQVGAGRYVRLRAVELQDSLRVTVTLYDTYTNETLIEVAVRIAADFAGADSAITALAEALLFREALPLSRSPPLAGTRSVPAQQAFARAQSALRQWDLARADSALVAATAIDGGYAQAWLWLAQVRSWMREAPARWEFAANKAYQNRANLGSRDRLLASALMAFVRRDFDQACGAWRELTALEEFDFSAWYGLATCLHTDSLVVPDERSPSGWRFRSSYHEALSAYVRAFALLPSMHSSLRGGSYADIRQLLMTGSNSVREGRAGAPDATRFFAYPSLDRDSLAFIPYPHERFEGARPLTRTQTTNDALLRQRRVFHELATMWLASYPRSVDAMEAMAIALELLGNDRAASDSLRVAMTLARSPGERSRLMALAAAIRVKYGAPDGLRELREARLLADSALLLAEPTTPYEARMLSGIAALTGRAARAASLHREASAGEPAAALVASAQALLAYAALGGPRDSLRSLQSETERGLEQHLLDSERSAVRSIWLLPSALLALPHFDVTALETDERRDGIYGALVTAWRRDDLTSAQQVIDTLRAYRARMAISAAIVTPDGLYSEAAVLSALGDATGAASWLDPTLNALAGSDLQNLFDAARAGPLVRAMVLRAELASKLGDAATARRWARAVVALWAEPDDFLKPTVRRMAQLAR